MRRAGLVSALACVVVAGCVERPPTVRPNVVVVCIDSLRADRLAPYGGPHSSSRTLTAIAEEGVVFERAFTVASWTKPSVASLLTGLYPSQHGLLASHDSRVDLLPEATTTLAETLRAGGYRTAAFVDNIHLQRAHSALDQGFEVFAEEVGSAREIINGFAAWQAAEDPRPFFAYLHILEPHWPYSPLPPPAGSRMAEDVTLRRLQWDLGGGRWPLLRDAVNEQGLQLAEDELAAIRSLYDGEIHDVDAALASLLALLRSRGLLERTLLVVTADHGEAFLDRGRLDHGYGGYEELLRIPLVMRFPGARDGGRRVARAVQIVDIAPTVVELAGIEALAPGGRSLLGAIRGERVRQDDEVLAEEVHGSVTMTALRTSRYKYLRTEDAAPPRRETQVPMPEDLRAGMRVRMEGIGARGAFIADEVKRVAPGDEDCEVTAPLAATTGTSTTMDVLGFPADVTAINAKERATLAGTGTENIVWAHVQGTWNGDRLEVDDVDAVQAEIREIEIEGLVESVAVTSRGVSLVVCGKRILVRVDARWKEFARPTKPVTAAMSEDTVPALREELYDVVSDPGESTNLVRERPEIAAELATRLSARRAELLAAVVAPERRSRALNDDVRERLQALGYAE